MIFRLLVCLLVLGTCFTQLSAATLPNPLKIVISNDTFPYMFTDENGQAAGLVVDYWQEIAKQQQIRVEFVAADWPLTLPILQRGEVHIHGGVAKTAERELSYQLGDTGIDIYSNVFVQRDLPAITKLTDLTPYVIGVVETSGHIEGLYKLIPGVTLRTYSTSTALYDAALSGQINALVALDRLTPRYARYSELARQFPMYRKIPLRTLHLSYAVIQNNPLFDALQQATSKIDRAFLDRLERHWLGDRTDDNTLILGLAVDNPPYMHVSLQGEAQGLFVDLWRQWAEQTGIKIAFVPDSSFQNLQNLKKGRIDALIAFPDNNLQQDGLMSAYQIYGFKSRFYSAKSNLATPLSSSAALKVAVFENAPYIAELELRYPKAEFIRYRYLPDIIKDVINNKLAGFYGAAAVIPLRLQQLNYTDLFIEQADSEIISPMYTLVREADSELAEKIRRGFAKLPFDTLLQVEKNWVPQTDLRYFPQFFTQVPLTQAEQSWVSEHPVLRIGMLNNWPPMEFKDDEGNPAGVTVDLVSLLGQRINVHFEIELYADFNLMLEDLKLKKLDLVANTSDQDDRHSYARFTDEFWPAKWVLISNDNRDLVVSATELDGKRIAIYKDYQMAKRINEVYPLIDVIPVNSLRAGLDLMQQHKVDFVMDSVETTSEILREAGYMYLRLQVLDDLPSYPSLIAVREDYAPLVTMLNKGLRSITAEDRQLLYQKWFNFQINQGINKAQLHQLMWQIGGAAALLIAVVLGWNLSLRSEVLLRRQAEQKMRFMATHDDLTKIPNRSLIKERIEQALLQHARHNEILALLFLDLDGFKEVNDQYGHDIGDELLLKLAGILGEAVRKSDTVARFGGDEFAILLTGLLSRDDAAIVAEKILHQLAQPFALSVGEVQISASIGIAIYPDDGTDCAKLLKVADSLMYRVKQQGKNQYCFSKAVI